MLGMGLCQTVDNRSLSAGICRSKWNKHSLRTNFQSRSREIEIWGMGRQTQFNVQLSRCFGTRALALMGPRYREEEGDGHSQEWNRSSLPKSLADCFRVM
jgi:hypothetical protein